MSNEAKYILYYDGLCGLCNKFLFWVIQHDPEGKFSFATLDSDRCVRLLRKHPEFEKVDSVILQSADQSKKQSADQSKEPNSKQLWVKGAAVRKVIHELSTPKWMKVAVNLTPGFILEKQYELVASMRYKIFGKLDSCPIPKPEDRHRFLLDD